MAHDTLVVPAGSPATTVIERIDLAPGAPDGPPTGSPSEGGPPPRPPHAPQRRPDQLSAADAAAQALAAWPRQEGFLGALLLASRPHDRLVACSWWADDPADGGAAAHPERSVLPAVRSAAPRAAVLDARAHTVAFAAGETPTEVSVTATPLAHSGVFDVTADEGAQERMVDLAREHAPGSLGTPGLVSITFHRSLDGLQVVNLGLWTTFDGFGELLAREGFRDEAPYWDGVAHFAPDFFDVVAVVGPPG